MHRRRSKMGTWIAATKKGCCTTTVYISNQRRVNNFNWTCENRRLCWKYVKLNKIKIKTMEHRSQKKSAHFKRMRKSWASRHHRRVASSQKWLSEQGINWKKELKCWYKNQVSRRSMKKRRTTYNERNREPLWRRATICRILQSTSNLMESEISRLKFKVQEQKANGN